VRDQPLIVEVAGDPGKVTENRRLTFEAPLCTQPILGEGAQGISLITLVQMHSAGMKDIDDKFGFGAKECGKLHLCAYEK
jgi:hypothetical protein